MFVSHQNDICENYIGSVYVGRYCGLSERGLCVFGNVCPVGHLIVYECSSVLLQRLKCSLTSPVST